MWGEGGRRRRESLTSTKIQTLRKYFSELGKTVLTSVTLTKRNWKGKDFSIKCSNSLENNRITCIIHVVNILYSMHVHDTKRLIRYYSKDVEPAADIIHLFFATHVFE